jgi:hypothetical protein
VRPCRRGNRTTRGITKRRKTKCGEMSHRESERFDSSVEVGELKPYEESME